MKIVSSHTTRKHFFLILQKMWKLFNCTCVLAKRIIEVGITNAEIKININRPKWLLRFFLQSMPKASTWGKGTGVKALLFSDLYFPSGHLVTSIDGKDMVFVLVFSHSGNTLCSTGSFIIVIEVFRSVNMYTEYILMNCWKRNNTDLKSCWEN